MIISVDIHHSFATMLCYKVAAMLLCNVVPTLCESHFLTLQQSYKYLCSNIMCKSIPDVAATLLNNFGARLCQTFILTVQQHCMKVIS